MSQPNKSIALKGMYCLMEAMTQHIQPWIDESPYEGLIANIQMEGHSYADVGLVLDDGDGLLRYIMYAGPSLNDAEKTFTEKAPKGLKERLPWERIKDVVYGFDLPETLKPVIAAILPTIHAETEHGPTPNTYKVSYSKHAVSLFIFCRAHDVLKVSINLTDLVIYLKLLEAKAKTPDTTRKQVSESLTTSLNLG